MGAFGGEKFIGSVLTWMVGSDGVRPGTLVASVSGLSRFAQLEGSSLKGLHNIVHLCVHRIFGFSNGNFLCGFR